MEEIKLTVAEADALLSAEHFNTMINLLLPAQAMYSLKNTVKILQDGIVTFNEVRAEVIKRYATLDKAGMPVMNGKVPAFPNKEADNKCISEIISVSKNPIDGQLTKIPVKVQDLPLKMSLAFCSYLEVFFDIDTGEDNG